ncbi:MAG: fructosamine kinase family protein [Microthrixaceae bacterium]
MDPDIAELMEAALGSSIMRTDNVHGGDFARAFRANLADGSSVFVKTHSNPPSGFFSTEAAGLAWLRAAGTLRVPEVLALSDEPAFLVLEWINTGSRHFPRRFWDGGSVRPPTRRAARSGC